MPATIEEALVQVEEISREMTTAIREQEVALLVWLALHEGDAVTLDRLTDRLTDLRALVAAESAPDPI